MYNDLETTPFYSELESIYPIENHPKDWVPLGSGKRILKGYHVNDQIPDTDYRIIKEHFTNTKNWLGLCKRDYDDCIYILKTIRPEYSTKIQLKRMMDEMRRMEKISSHPNVIKIHDAFIVNDIPHIIMEYACGVSEDGKQFGNSLYDLIENGWPFSFLDILWISMSVCRGLSHCQKNISNFIHGDIKPGNILFTPSEGESASYPGLCKYRIMIADFGGGKTKGYYVSPEDSTSTAEDDIYAFAKTMEQVFVASYYSGMVNQTPYLFWHQFLTGLEMILYNDCSTELRRNLDFYALYNGYAEAFTSTLHLLYGIECDPEDILPNEKQGIRAQAVDILNRCSRKAHTANEDATIESDLLQLLRNPEIIGLYFDEMPVFLLTLFNLLQFYKSHRQWESFDKTLYEIRQGLLNVKKPIHYRGNFHYSSNIDEAIDIIEQLVAIERGKPVQIELLISTIRLDIPCESWLEQLLHYIRDKAPEKLNAIKRQINALTDSSEDIIIRQRYHEILEIYYYFLEDYANACPHIKFLSECQPDNILICFKYAVCLYNTNHIIHSMMYFEHIYDIYMLETEFYNQNWQIVQMGLLSLLYMCDYACLNGHCQQIIQHRKEKLSYEDQQWFDSLQKMSRHCQKIFYTWHFKSGQALLMHEAGNEKGIELIKSAKDIVALLITVKKTIHYFPELRVWKQIYFESVKDLAEIYAAKEEYLSAISECDNIIQLDCTNFTGYRIRGECNYALWKQSGLEEKRTAAIYDFEIAKKYVYAMFPAQNGLINPKAESWITEINRKLEELE